MHRQYGVTGVAHKARAAQPSLASVEWAVAWPLVPHSRTLERPTLGSVRLFAQTVTQMSHIFTQRAPYFTLR